MAGVNTGGIALQLATGAEHTCALLSPGILKCWGRNESGQLGRGNTASLSSPPASPVDLGGTMVHHVGAGAWHTCALPSAGEPRCWGRNTHGQLGLGHTYNLGDNEVPSGAALTTPLPPQVVETSQSAASVSGGGSLTFQAQAMDPQASRLSFSWTANVGTLSTATMTTDTSQVLWTAPSCTNPGVGVEAQAAPAKRARPLPRTSWEGGLGRRVSHGAARLLHPPGVLLGRPRQRPSSAPALQPSPSTWPLSRLYATRCSACLAPEQTLTIAFKRFTQEFRRQLNSL